MKIQRRLGDRSLPGAVVPLVLAAAAAAILVAPAASDRSERDTAGGMTAAVDSGTQPGNHDEPPPLAGDKPCTNGARSSMNEEARRHFITIKAADHALANDAAVQAVWWCAPLDASQPSEEAAAGEAPRARSGGVVIEYVSGIRIYLMPNILTDPAASWEDMARTESGASTGSVKGHTASLVQPDPAIDAPGGVRFVEDDVLVVLTGDGTFPLKTLEDVAETITDR